MPFPFVARPYYNGFGAHYLSEKACWYGQTTNQNLNVMTGQQVGSILPDTFNQLLCLALNTEVDGVKPTHFVMLHGDIAPQDGWLQMLIEEMEDRKLEVLSGVVPLKAIDVDDSSTAIGNLCGQDSVFRRLTLKECQSLPATFDLEDVEHADNEKLLLNTGLLGIDLRAPWVEDWAADGAFHFETYTWKQEDGKWKSITLPEDWLFSWEVQTRYNAKVAATTKIRLIHFGEVGFANRPSAQEAECPSPSTHS